MTRIKICGLTESQHVEAAARLGVDFIGFVFATSKRRITPAKAAMLIKAAHQYPAHPAAVGVFVNKPASDVNRIAKQCRLDWVQLSGDETWNYCRRIEKPIIKVIHITPDKTVSEIIKTIEAGYNLFPKDRFIVLFDSKIEGSYGGTGKSFNWKLIEKISRKLPVFIAGGLNPDNIGGLIKQAHPWGVDVSSGIELNGKKDTSLIQKFVNNVRNADIAQKSIEDSSAKEGAHVAR